MLSCSNSGMYSASKFLGGAGSWGTVGGTVTWDLGYNKFMVPKADEDESFEIRDLCTGCDTLENVGSAFASFAGLALVLLVVAMIPVLMVMTGVGIGETSSKLAFVSVNLSFFLSFLASLMYLIGVAAVVNSDEDEYRFALVDPDKFKPMYGAICGYVSLLLYIISVGLMRQLAGHSGGGGGGGISMPKFSSKSPSMKFGANQRGSSPKRSSGVQSKSYGKSSMGSTKKVGGKKSYGGIV